MRLGLIAFFISFHLCNVKCLLVKPQASCVPTQIVKGPCHECMCDVDGVFVCHATTCPKSAVNPRKSYKGECQPHVTYKFEELYCTCNFEGRWLSFNCRETFQYLRSYNKAKHILRSTSTIPSTHNNINHHELPEIEDGESCVPGKLYKISCNTCQCGKQNMLLCTKMACFENVIQRVLRKVGDKPKKKEKKKEVKVTEKGSLRKGPENNGKKKLINSEYPQLPEGKCVPGKIYKNGCKKCFCNEKMVAKCTRTCSGGSPNRFSDKEISEMETRSVVDLPELPHMGVKCDPGKTYYVVCNICFCTHKHDLYCTVKYCINIASVTEVQSKELTGRPCKKDFKLLCSECKCVNGKNQCRPIPNCDKNLTGKQLLSSAADTNIKLTLDIEKEKCQPHVSYKFHCNECYCQPDGSLRCTQKICLTYSQTKDLQEKQTYLEKHGL
ncbi:uncharacterized protein LOC120637391 [Pararge aegeria]|uniref:uncharacterized protein LOC120637391 n=1 Tax=Pararge aegeria TaxID=116150 RepID=UPI0019D10FDE|nr:uncharacterized protein LOC120637391 [Pararge aegeria]